MVNLPPVGTDEFFEALKQIKKLVKEANERGLDQFVWRGQTIMTSYAESILSTFDDEDDD